jgi:AraC-like DNA-binding protein
MWTSQDPDEMVQLLSRQLAPHRLVPCSAGRRLNVRVGTLPLGRALLVDVGYGADVDVYPCTLSDAYLVHASVSGNTQMQVGSQVILLHSQNTPISSVGMQPRFHMSSACRHLTLRIPRGALEAYFCAALEQPIEAAVNFGPEMADNAAFSRAWRHLLAHIQSQAVLLPHLLASERMQSHYSAALLDMLLQSAPHSYSHFLETGRGRAASHWHVRRACAVVESCMGESLSVGIVARRVGVSVRGLQAGFRRSLGVTPLQFIRERRLERLHASLLSSDPTASVTQLMLDCGIVNFGRFARYYQARFGCLPSVTLARHEPLR